MTDAANQTSPPLRWQDARRVAAELPIDLPQPAPGTAVYISTAGADTQTLTLLRAFVRAAERKGHKVKLL
jgi:uncharacterized membrane protein YebE (DUF533 family)